MMSNLTKRVEEWLGVNEKHNLRESYAHCQSPSVKEQTKFLDQATLTIWFAGHHCGFHKGCAVENTRLAEAHKALVVVVDALLSRAELSKMAQAKVKEHYQKPWYEDIKLDAEPLEQAARSLSLSFKECEALAALTKALPGVGG